MEYPIGKDETGLFLGHLFLAMGQDDGGKGPGAQGLITLLGNGGLDAIARSYRETETPGKQYRGPERGRSE